MHCDRVVLVADERDPQADTFPIRSRRDLEQTERRDMEELVAGIESLGHRVVLYGSPKELSLHVGLHRDDLVWSIYGGARSRNRMALVPAICEANGLAFVGPDAYGRVICQNKEVSKRLAQDCGLKTPPFRIVRGAEDIPLVLDFPLPAVVKPLLEGSSIGITQQSLVASRDALVCQLELLLEMQMQPVMIESFVAGREVSYNVIETHGDPRWNLCEVRMGDDPDFFDHGLFDAELKLRRDVAKTRHEISGELLSDDRSKCDALISAIGHVGYCRVDGKLLDGEFWFLEVTPDAYLGKDGTFCAGFTSTGMSYADMIGAIIATGRREPLAQ